jgi:hypothetical protein
MSAFIFLPSFPDYLSFDFHPLGSEFALTNLAAEYTPMYCAKFGRLLRRRPEILQTEGNEATKNPNGCMFPPSLLPAGLVVIN